MRIDNLFKTLALTISMVVTASIYAQKPQLECLLGGDISMLTKYEEKGAKYYDINGNSIQPLSFFKQEGMNAMRVRLFVDPTSSANTDTKGACQDLDYVIKLGKRIQDAGYKLIVDFHYSDTWADPGKQTLPKAW